MTDASEQAPLQPEIINLLMERDELAATERSNAKILKKYARYEILILDDGSPRT